MLCYSNPELCRAPSSHQAISDLCACGHAIPPIRNVFSILPDSFLLILQLVEALGLDQEIT